MSGEEETAKTWLFSKEQIRNSPSVMKGVSFEEVGPLCRKTWYNVIKNDFFPRNERLGKCRVNSLQRLAKIWCTRPPSLPSTARKFSSIAIIWSNHWITHLTRFFSTRSALQAQKIHVWFALFFDLMLCSVGWNYLPFCRLQNGGMLEVAQAFHLGLESDRSRSQARHVAVWKVCFWSSFSPRGVAFS